MENDDIGADAAVERAMQNLEKEGLLDEQNAGQQVSQTNSPLDAGEAGTGDNQSTDETSKPNEQEQAEAETPIEPPASWRAEEKELFRGLPREAQEATLRIQQAQDSHFTQRSTELAQKIRATDDERNQYQSERARFMGELARVSQMASAILPAKFQDIQSHSDFLRLKATDPARASEFESFMGTLNMAQQQMQHLQVIQQQEHLNREYQLLQEKYPVFQDPQKAASLIGEVRKGAVEYYGFSPQEVQVIQDHRYIPIIQDAMAWRQYQANLKIAQTKKSAPAPSKVLPRTSNNGGPSMADDQKAALLKRARNATSDRDKADLIAQALGF